MIDSLRSKQPNLALIAEVIYGEKQSSVCRVGLTTSEFSAQKRTADILNGINHGY